MILTNEIVKKRSGFKTPPKLVDFGISQDISIDDIFKETIIQHDGMIKSLVKVLNTGTKNDLKAANNLKEYFSTD